MDENRQKAAATNLQQIVADQQAKIEEQQKYMEALVSEFSECRDLEAVRTKFRDKVTEFAPAALVNIISLANNAESESVRGSLNKWIIEWAMNDKIDGQASELKKLLEGITKPASTTEQVKES
jgi:uncharacterized coiled-coil protein SlyX